MSPLGSAMLLLLLLLLLLLRELCAWLLQARRSRATRARRPRTELRDGRGCMEMHAAIGEPQARGSSGAERSAAKVSCIPAPCAVRPGFPGSHLNPPDLDSPEVPWGPEPWVCSRAPNTLCARGGPEPLNSDALPDGRPGYRAQRWTAWRVTPASSKGRRPPGLWRSPIGTSPLPWS